MQLLNVPTLTPPELATRQAHQDRFMLQLCVVICCTRLLFIIASVAGANFSRQALLKLLFLFLLLLLVNVGQLLVTACKVTVSCSVADCLLCFSFIHSFILSSFFQ